MSLRVLFLTPHPIEAANSRYRVHLFLPYLNARGYECDVAPFLKTGLFRDFYSPGRVMGKTIGLTRAVLGRIDDVVRARKYDVVFISREAMLFGPPVIEWLLGRVVRCPIVFDFDDAIFVSYVSPTYGRIATWLKYPAKTARILEMSAQVIAGNSYLADFARKYNQQVTIVPTVVDTERFWNTPPEPRVDERPVVGWIGTHSTAQYLDLILPALQKVAEKHDFVFRVIGAGREIKAAGVTIDNREWKLEAEIRDFRSLDIGVYPIRDDAWARGKCAFKAIQYMAAGVPCVCSSVGMASEVVNHGVNGFLANSIEEWEERLDLLLNDERLRGRFSLNGRETVAKSYSLDVHASRFADTLVRAAALSK